MYTLTHTNTHRLQVPELDEDFEPRPAFGPLLERLARGQALLGKASAVPMLVRRGVAWSTQGCSTFD